MKPADMKYHTNQPGFSLLEMLIVLALIAITSHFVLVNYQSFTGRNHRRIVEIILQEAAGALEDYAAEHMTYLGASLEKLNIHTHEIDKYYLIEMKNIESDYYQLAATPLGNQADSDTCGTLLLDSSGRKSSSSHDIHCW
jgi:prepilin-type N-terminal cleavage/methylation domain-containing protein